MVGTAVDDAQGMAAGGKVEVHGINDRVIPIQKVDGHQIAHGGGGLIHKTAGLAEKHIFRILTDLRHFGRRYAGVKEQMIDDRTHQHLKGSRRGKTAAGQHRRLAVSVKAPYAAAQLDKAGCNAADQRGCGIDLIGRDFQIAKLHNGSLTLSNAEGGGTLVDLRLPIDEE